MIKNSDIKKKQVKLFLESKQVKNNGIIDYIYKTEFIDL